MSALAVVEPTIYAPKKLDIACGQNKKAGFIGIDLAGDAEIIHDLYVMPWPIKTGSVSEIHISHFVEHIPHYLPQWGHVDGWWVFWDEVYRIARKGAKVTVVHPYGKNGRAFQDPSHTRYLIEDSWAYLSLPWRTKQEVDHYPVAANFEVITIAGMGVAESVATRNQEHQTFAREHYWNVIADLVVELKAVK